MLVSWPEQTGTLAELRGPLANRLENELRMEGRERWALQWENFRLGVGAFMRALEDPQGRCSAEGELLKCDDNLTISRQGTDWEFVLNFEESYFFKGLLRQKDAESHKGLALFLDHRQRRAEDGAVLGLELFIRECIPSNS